MSSFGEALDHFLTGEEAMAPEDVETFFHVLGQPIAGLEDEDRLVLLELFRNVHSAAPSAASQWKALTALREISLKQLKG